MSETTTLRPTELKTEPYEFKSGQEVNLYLPPEDKSAPGWLEDPGPYHQRLCACEGNVPRYKIEGIPDSFCARCSLKANDDYTYCGGRPYIWPIGALTQIPPDHKYTTSFVVMPKHCNYLGDMIFGGELLSQMDIAAAMAVRRAMYNCEHKKAVTVRVTNVNFMVAALVGDLIQLEATVDEVTNRTLIVHVYGWREKQGTGVREKICYGEFTFCAISDNRMPVRHNLTLE